MPRSVCLPPVEYSRGTSPTQAANGRPLRNAPPFPIAATSAVAVSGPIPGIASRRWQTSLFCAALWIPAPEGEKDAALFRGIHDESLVACVPGQLRRVIAVFKIHIEE